jgi:dTDP-4-dehydrorhamnose 3,5-epimerase
MQEFERLKIEDVILVKPKVFGDERGYFTETYKKSEFFKNGINVEFMQDNMSQSTKGVLRGLHYQANPKPQAKLVRCIKGKIFDVAVDLRKNSKTFGAWVGEILSDENKHALFIPEGFAHGFVVLSDIAQVYYKASNEFDMSLDRGILWNDPDVGVDWGLDALGIEPVLSDKDKNQKRRLKDVGDLL